MAGDLVTFTCSITLPAGVTGIPDFQWLGPGVTPTPADPTTSGQEVSSVLTLGAAATSQAGQYSCTATFSAYAVNDMSDVIVISKFTYKLKDTFSNVGLLPHSPIAHPIHYCQS